MVQAWYDDDDDDDDDSDCVNHTGNTDRRRTIIIIILGTCTVKYCPCISLISIIDNRKNYKYYHLEPDNFSHSNLNVIFPGAPRILTSLCAIL